MKKISLLVPVYNEEKSIRPFVERMTPILENTEGILFEYIFVNDGSRDNTYAELLKLSQEIANVKIIQFSRNFGKEKAMMAGIQHCQESDALIISDIDLQDPPEVITEFIQKWQEGYKNIYGVRDNRKEDSFLKRLTASVFYRIFNAVSSISIPVHAGDFRLLDKAVVKTLAQIQSKNLFMKGLYAWAGYSSIGVYYKREKRAIGKSKFNFLKLLKLSLDGVFSFSSAPLKFSMVLGILVSFTSFIFGLVMVVKKLLYGNPVAGYTSLMVSICFFFGIQFILIGIIGEYIARIYDEVKKEPPFVIESILESKNNG